MEFLAAFILGILVLGYVLLGVIQFVDFVIQLIRIQSIELVSIKSRIKFHGLSLGLYFLGLWLQIHFGITLIISIYLFVIPWVFVVNWIQIRKVLGSKITTEWIINDVLKA